ncbi:MAG TPA: HAMP domain-containing sensor histidine kinase [Actinophytocola sp.]|uniref:sensor histidine kinase n=1 Tax=Actinophytocola sp. TaxID=1872138 RepID=UPI002DDCB1B7|nr:HAMP domain-containing sensor histidine kinase [Actinophytocola sp.]HEV2777834.1 HAMP domain-containing sensor histidine kinase [Actinophytocola sp.]
MTRKWTLRARIVAALLVLATVALLVFGVASVLLIRKSQLDRVDRQLSDLTRAFADRPGLGRRLVTPGTPANGSDNLPTDYRVLVFTPGGTPTRAFGQREGETGGPQLPAINEATAATQIQAPFTVPDTAGGASWRVRVMRIPDGFAAVAQSLDTVEATTRQLVVIESVVGALLLVVLGSVGFSVVRLGLRPLTRMEQTAAAIADGDLDRRVPDTDSRTETGRLGRALNTMLGRLASAMRQRERSEARLRRFVADASHELRTPLTSIRGFAELYRRGDRSDVDRLMGRIEEEAVRMGTLVDDLLLLAKLDEQRSLELGEVDLVVLAADAVHDVSVRDPDRRVRLETPDGPVRVTGDEHRLRQVTMNLVTNAVTHTPPGTPITVTVAVQSLNGKRPAASAGDPLDDLDEAAVLEVRDTGDGIPLDEAPLVFDRFYRVDAGRSRRSGGTGLGLAITAAILSAHHGRIDLHTRPGAGATFRVLLPLAEFDEDRRTR